MHLTYRQSCRICGSKCLTDAIDLGEQHLQGSFIKPGRPLPPTRRISTLLKRCDPARDQNGCGLLQMAVSVPPEVLYASYWYRSGTNETMRNHLGGIVEEALKLAPETGRTVLDIGCNDGTLLRCYPESHRRIGVDPSDIAKATTGDFEIIHDFFPSAVLDSHLAGRRCDIITSIAMFYDLEDPVRFVAALKSLLAPDGIWIFEMSYMPKMLEMNSYDTICHEHLEYYSLAVIERLLGMCKMKIVNVSFNDINGGSIRCFATHADCNKYNRLEFQAALSTARMREFDLSLDTEKPYRQFQERITHHRREISTLLKELQGQGKSIHVYGASTKGNTILQWCGLDNTIIACAADRNPEKYGARTIGTDIPIVAEEKSRAMKPDYYLVLPWHFRGEFLKREAAAVSSGTKFIFPLPTIEIIGT